MKRACRFCTGAQCQRIDIGARVHRIVCGGKSISGASSGSSSQQFFAGFIARFRQ